MDPFTPAKYIANITAYVLTLDKTVSINDAKAHLQEMVISLQARYLEMEQVYARCLRENDQYRQREEERIACRAEKAAWQTYSPTPGVFIYALQAAGQLVAPYDGSFECFCRNCADQHERKCVIQLVANESYKGAKYTCHACGFSFTVPCHGNIPLGERIRDDDHRRGCF